jgi:hypothetical protein
MCIIPQSQPIWANPDYSEFGAVDGNLRWLKTFLRKGAYLTIVKNAKKVKNLSASLGPGFG